MTELGGPAHSPFSDRRRLANGEFEGVLAGAIAGCSAFPYDGICITPVDSSPLDPNSAAYVDIIRRTIMHADLGSDIWDAGSIAIPFGAVPGTTACVAVAFDYADESDPGPDPIPPNAPIEGGSDSTGDCYVLVADHKIAFYISCKTPGL